MKQEICQDIANICGQLFGIEPSVELETARFKFGDWSTNVAMKLAGQVAKKPQEIAQQIANRLPQTSNYLDSVEVAGPGFINLKLTDKALWQLADAKRQPVFKNQTVVVEYSDPNPFKILHAGHLYTSIVGDSIARLVENSGARVIRLNFGGDVGLHVGKTLWAVIEELGGQHPEGLADIKPADRPDWISRAYIKGTQAFDNDQSVRAKILQLNKKVYQLHKDSDRKSPFAQIYWTCREWSYDYFKDFYNSLDIQFDRYIPESETTEVGLKTVKEHVPQVFTKSEGAVVFKGENYDPHLHTRVFVNSEGIPTYETKDVGLIMIKARDYQFDRSIVITGNEQQQYMRVVLKAIEQFAPGLAKATTHLTHGLVKLEGGRKMSSRSGNILSATDVINAAELASRQINGKRQEQTIVLAAVKYAFLKTRMSGDIIYNPQESVQVNGNSGPYLQYAHARARSILKKSETRIKESKTGLDLSMGPQELEPSERQLLKKIGQYNGVVEEAAVNFSPHHVCTFLYELSQTFNNFYEQNRVVGHEREELRLALVERYADSLKNGLELLNIQAPEKM